MKKTILWWMLAILLLGAPASAGSIEEAQALLSIGQWAEAVEAFQSLPPEIGSGVDALCGLAQAYRGLGKCHKAVDAANAAAAAASEDADLARARIELGRSLLSCQKKKFYPDAVEAFREAVELNYRPAYSRLFFAEALLYQKDVATAKPILEELVADDPSSATGIRAAALLRNPENVALQSLPAFVMTTVDGQSIRSGDQLGKVVIFDFWATWCKPCVASIPKLARFHEYSSGKPIQLISISVDEDADTLRNFLKEREIDWPMVHDKNRVLARYFGVRQFPTYLLFDPDGFIQMRSVGYSESFNSSVDQLIRKSKQMAKNLRD